MKQILVIHGGDSFGTEERYISFLKNFEIENLEYFKDRGHFSQTHFPEIVEAIQKIK